MVLESTLDKKLIDSDAPKYKLRSVYVKNNLAHIKFETKFGMHRGTFKISKLCINPETGKEYLYDEIEKAVKRMFSINVKKKYAENFTKNIDKIIEIKDE